MKKLLLMMGLALTCQFIFSQGTAYTMADFETITPSIFAPANAGTAQVIANPVKEGINTSDNVLEFVRAGGSTYQNFGMEFTQPWFGLKNVVKVEFKLYGTISSLFVQSIKGEGGAENVMWSNSLNESGWTQYSYSPDYSAQGDSTLKGFAFFPNMESDADAGTYYLDDVVIYVLESSVTGVSLPATLELAVNETKQLVPEITPADAANQNVTWESSNEAIATVDAEGNVTGVAEGSCDVTVTTEDGGYTATTTVTVAGTLELQEVHLNFTALTMVPGEKFLFHPAFIPENAPDQNTTYSSSDEAVATVDNDGNITVLALGSCTITVTAGNAGRTDECAITVIEEAPFMLDNDTIANFETVHPYKGLYDGKWQFYGSGIDSATAVIANPFVDSDNGTDSVAQQIRPEGQWKVAGFKIVGGLPITSDIESVEFMIYASNLEKVNAVVTGAIDGRNINNENKFVETAWPWDAPVGANAWNKIVLPIDASKYLNDTIHNVNMFANPMNSDPAAVTVYIDEVIINRTVFVTGVTLDVTSATIDEGDDLYLTPTISPGNASNLNVTWTSSDESVATVNSFGKVTGEGPGTATITVTTEDGSYSATCEVTVEEVIIQIESISLEGSITIDVDEEYTLTATIAPEDATETELSWSSADDAIATVDQNGLVTGVAAGTTTITVDAVVGDATASTSVTVEEVVGLQSAKSKMLKVYPNPYSSGDLIIETGADISADVEVGIYDLTGKMVYSVSKYITGNEITLQPYLEAGSYILKLDLGAQWKNILLQVK
jgi:uncharacterized protein YjdB